MNTRQAYNIWADQYDTNHNKTRDVEAISLQQTLAGKTFNRILEIGCGTGKNTMWLQHICKEMICVDLSEEMLVKAREKISSDKVRFTQTDILHEWNFANAEFDLITFSLVLEHIEHLDEIITKAAAVLKQNGNIYIGELHPFKQYAGSKARFNTDEGLQIIECYNHHISDFTNAAFKNGLIIEKLNEYFDEDNRTTLPRIFTLLLRKP